MELQRATQSLIDTIRATEVYKNFEVQQQKIKDLPELKQKIDEFRKRNYELQTVEESGDLFERVDAFEKEYASFRENPMVEDFLSAELSLCRMMQEVYGQLTEAVNIEY